MKVQVDNVWATPSALHMRVTVWADDGRWRHRYDVHVPAEEIHPEAVEMLLNARAAARVDEDQAQESLF